MQNPIKQFRKRKNLSIRAFAILIGSNSVTIKNVETKRVLVPEDIIRKIGLTFDDANEGKLLQEYNEWENEREVCNA